LFLTSAQELARTFRQRREELGLSTRQVAAQADVDDYLIRLRARHGGAGTPGPIDREDEH
jgi:hypothetical protein